MFVCYEVKRNSSKWHWPDIYRERKFLWYFHDRGRKPKRRILKQRSNLSAAASRSFGESCRSSKLAKCAGAMAGTLTAKWRPPLTPLLYRYYTTSIFKFKVALADCENWVNSRECLETRRLDTTWNEVNLLLRGTCAFIIIVVKPAS